MPFRIALKDVPFLIEEELVLEGKICIGEFVESFHTPVVYWDKDQYLKSWIHSFEQIRNNKNRAGLVTSIHDPKHANFIFLWVMYLEESTVYFQNSIVFFDEIEGTFDEKNISLYVKDRETQNEDGIKISEWKSNIDEVAAYFSQLKNTLI